MTWEEVKGLEREIILSIKKRSKSVSQISEDIKKTKPNVSQAIKRMSGDGILNKNPDYSKDSRFSLVSVNFEVIKVKWTHSFYFIFYGLSLFLTLISGAISLIWEIPQIFIGSIIGIIPLTIYLVIQAYLVGDKIIVEKNLLD